MPRRVRCVDPSIPVAPAARRKNSGSPACRECGRASPGDERPAGAMLTGHPAAAHGLFEAGGTDGLQRYFVDCVHGR